MDRGERSGSCYSEDRPGPSVCAAYRRRPIEVSIGGLDEARLRIGSVAVAVEGVENGQRAGSRDAEDFAGVVRPAVVGRAVQVAVGCLYDAGFGVGAVDAV